MDIVIADGAHVLVLEAAALITEVTREVNMVSWFANCFSMSEEVAVIGDWNTVEASSSGSTDQNRR